MSYRAVILFECASDPRELQVLTLSCPTLPSSDRAVPPPRVRRPVDAGGDAGGRVIHDDRLNAGEHLRRLRTVLPQDVVEGPRRPLVYILQLVLEDIGDRGHLATGVIGRALAVQAVNAGNPVLDRKSTRLNSSH